MCLSENLYEDVVTICTTLILAGSQSEQGSRSLERILMEASSIDDIYRMPLLLDIWMLFLR